MLNEESWRDILIAAAAYSVARLPFLLMMPLILDEALYSIMFFEQMQHATLIPTFLGYPVSWKPAPFFWAYGLMAEPFLRGGVPFDIAYRLPSFIFGLLSMPLLYSIILRAGKSAKVALISCLAFAFSGIAIYAQSTALSDSAALFFILASLHLYMDSTKGKERFPLAGLLASAAFFFKLIFAFIPGLLGAIYLFSCEKKSLRDPLFILSLLMVPLAMAGHLLLLDSEGLSMEFLIGNFSKHVVSEQGVLGQLLGPLNSLSYLLVYSPFFVAMSLIGFAKHWRENLMMSAWFMLSLVPVFSSSALPWYFLPTLPAISFFCALPLMRHGGKERADAFAFIVFAMLAVASLGLYSYLSYETYRIYQPEKDVGLMLSGKENALIIGRYKPSIFAYKMLSEEAAAGKSLDFGWIMAKEKDSAGMLAAFVSDYNTRQFNVTDGSFSPAFATPMVFRKDSNLTSFEYIAVCGFPDYVPEGPEPIFSDNTSMISLYRVPE